MYTRQLKTLDIIYIIKDLMFFTMQARLSIYKTTILPNIDYDDIFYQEGSKTVLKKIQDKQTKALKLC